MKKFLSILLTLSLCLAICFCFVGCDSEFNGNYVKASDEQIDQTFKQVEGGDVDIKDRKGVQLTMKATFTGDMQGTSTATIKANIEKQQFAASIKSNGTMTNKEGEKTTIKSETGIYVKDGFGYSFTSYDDGNKKEAKSKFPIPDAALNVMFSKAVNEAFNKIDLSEFTDILGESSAELKAEGIEVYIDNAKTGIKIKVVCSGKKADGKESNYKGTFIFVFNQKNVITALKVDLTAKLDDKTTSKTTLTLKDFNGSISLPSGASDWKVGAGFEF